MARGLSSVHLDVSIAIRVFDGVYDPAEDSYLLLRCLDVEKGQHLLDMGTGTGILALHAASQGARVTAADKSLGAVLNARYNARLNGLTLNVVHSDLFSSIPGAFDVISFNPPYLPSRHTGEPWEGGAGGTAVTRRFLQQAAEHLRPGGCIYLVASTRGDVAGLLEDFSGRYTFQDVGREAFFFERLIVYRLAPRPSRERY
ncbi:MAG TPA: methyltransferase domain-containing protein [Thermoplasmatales archaeon]|nr:methyltransferase domain-containing protein [Thermoplasmatales archaeon]